MSTKQKLNEEQKKDSQEWDEKRVNVIGQNGNDGSHYDHLVEDAHLWDNRELGADEEFVSVMEDYQDYADQEFYPASGEKVYLAAITNADGESIFIGVFSTEKLAWEALASTRFSGSRQPSVEQCVVDYKVEL